MSNKPTDRFAPCCPVLIYTNKIGGDPLFFESITQASKELSIPTRKIKELIFNGGSVDGYTGFDIPQWCNFDVISSVVNGKIKFTVVKVD
ncbi:MAG: hypothetical protein PQJ49_11155 [Sphaerochaetaceae bacterium]|jgi:hypothetical protein|nr:hypothetical protein [Sphaerochaetaceae bacterium]